MGGVGPKGPGAKDEDKDGPTTGSVDGFACVRRSTSARAAARAAESTRERFDANDHLL